MKLTRIVAVCLIGMFTSTSWAQNVVPTRASGDVTGDEGEITLTDAIYLLNWLYNGGPDPAPVFCEQEGGSVQYPLGGASGYRPQFASGSPGHTADVNGDGGLDISDAISLLNWLFLGGAQPAPMSCVAFGDV